MNIFHDYKLFRCSPKTITLFAFVFLLSTGSAFGAGDQGTSSDGRQNRHNQGLPMNPGEGAGDDATSTPGGSKNKTGKTGKGTTAQPRVIRRSIVKMPNMRFSRGSKRPRYISKKTRTLEVYGP